MPIITCPKCQGKLRFPEDTPPRRVKCPTCGNVFLSADGTDASAAPVPSASRPDLPRARDSKGDFDLPDVDDRPRPRRDEDDDYDRRRSRRRYEEEEDDRPRRRGRDDEDDDYDRRRRGRYKEDDYDDRPSRRRRDDDFDRGPRRPDPRAVEGQFNRASLACLLLFIAGWLQVAGLGLAAFQIFLDWCGVREGLTLFSVLAGLLGIGGWLTAAVGLGFMISGPRERGALGLSIAAAATGGLHLMLLIVVATTRTVWAGPGGEFRTAEVHWLAFVTQSNALPNLLCYVIGLSEIVRGGVSTGTMLPVFANLAEVARGVLLLLTLRSFMLCARDSRGASVCTKTVVGYACTAGGLLVLGVLFGLLMIAVLPANRGRDFVETFNHLRSMYSIVMYLTLTGVTIAVTLIIKSVKGRIDYRR